MAEDILTTHKDNLLALANMLIEREVVFGEDLESIFGKRKNENGEEVETLSRGVKTERDRALEELHKIEEQEKEEEEKEEENDNSIT